MADTVSIPADVARTFVEIFDEFPAEQISHILTCDETNALTAMMTALGAPHRARMWAESHTESHTTGTAPCPTNDLVKPAEEPKP